MAADLRPTSAGRVLSDPEPDRSAVVVADARVAAAGVATAGVSCCALPHPASSTPQATSATPATGAGASRVSRLNLDSDPCLSGQPSAGHGRFQLSVIALVLVCVGVGEVDDRAIELL